MVECTACSFSGLRTPPKTGSIVDAISRVFDELKTTTVVKPASEATIADVTGADIVLFGVEKPGSADVPPEYSEWIRVFKGITLAGRTAGFFSMGSGKATARLRKALKDTEISAERR